MLQLGKLEAGSRHDLHVGISPDAPPDEGADLTDILDQRDRDYCIDVP